TEQRRTILGGIAASRGSLARLLGDYERAIPLAQQALDLLQEMEETLLIRLIYPTALLTVASSYLGDGDLTAEAERQAEATLAFMRRRDTLLGDGDLTAEAERQAEATVAFMRRRDTLPTNLPPTLRCLSNLARLHLLQERLHQAASTIEQLLHQASGHEGLQA